MKEIHLLKEELLEPQRVKSSGVKASTYIYPEVENNEKDPNVKVVDHVIISKYMNIFAKSYDNSFNSKI